MSELSLRLARLTLKESIGGITHMPLINVIYCFKFTCLELALPSTLSIMELNI